MKKQIVVIGGGMTFDTYEDYIVYLKECVVETDTRKGWKDTLQENLGDEFEIIKPTMPNKMNAKYFEWKIWFEKYFPYINDGVVLIGHSLGGAFLAKYLSENIFPKKIQGVFLVAAVHFGKDSVCQKADFELPEDLSLLSSQTSTVHLYHSVEDPEVSFGDLEKFTRGLPSAKVTTFENRGHFIGETFPEIIKDSKEVF